MENLNANSYLQKANKTGTSLTITNNIESLDNIMLNNEASTWSTNETNRETLEVLENDDSLRYILVPLGVLVIILLLSAVVYLMARNRRRLAHTFCKRKLTRNFGQYEDDSDGALEQGNFNENDIDDPTEWLLKGKLQINNHYDVYQSTQNSPMANNKRELYT